jgi:hypothetical protein
MLLPSIEEGKLWTLLYFFHRNCSNRCICLLIINRHSLLQFLKAMPTSMQWIQLYLRGKLDLEQLSSFPACCNKLRLSCFCLCADEQAASWDQHMDAFHVLLAWRESDEWARWSPHQFSRIPPNLHSSRQRYLRSEGKNLWEFWGTLFPT